MDVWRYHNSSPDRRSLIIWITVFNFHVLNEEKSNDFGCKLENRRKRQDKNSKDSLEENDPHDTRRHKRK